MAIAEGLQSNNTLMYLDLEGNVIELEGVIAIGHLLESNDTLTSFKFCSSYLLISPATSEEASKAIAKGLQSNRSLTALDLSSIYLGDGGAITIMQSLESNNTLTWIKLYNNSIGDYGSAAIKYVLQSNNTLTYLDFV